MLDARYYANNTAFSYLALLVMATDSVSSLGWMMVLLNVLGMKR